MFDEVDIEISMSKSEIIGRRDPLLTWLNSFLYDWGQFVVKNGLKSNICIKVPQGSHIGPILFSLFVSDVKDKLNL